MVRYFSYSIPAISFFFIIFFIPILAARPTPSSTLATQTLNTSWQNFSKFIDAGKGSQLHGMSELKLYFHRFGYLSKGPLKDDSTDRLPFSDEFDEELEMAVFDYQKRLGLQATGKLDKDTIKTMMTPRCGMPDTSPETRTSDLHTTKHYSHFNGKPRWMRPSPINLTYAFSGHALNTIDYLTPMQLKSTFAAAFARWEKVIPVSFHRINDYNSADITIEFFKGDHGDGAPFDGAMGILAHAFSPEQGWLHLDAAETWAVDFRIEKSERAVDLESVVTHEIGHLLGLGHSSVKEAVMYPTLDIRTKHADLKLDDVEGVQALYGSNPNFNISSLDEPGVNSSEASMLTRMIFNCYVDCLLLLMMFLIIS